MITAVFADVGSIYQSVRNQYQGKVDYGKILNELSKEGHEIVRAYAYGSQDPTSKEVIPFILALRNLGFTEKFEKGGIWHSRLTIDALVLANRIHQAVFITDDVQYCYLMHHLKNQSIKVTSYCLLTEFPICDKMIRLTRYYLDEPV